MASSTVTVQDGSLAAVASGNGQNVTSGNVTTVTLTDVSNVLGWQLRSIWNNQGASDTTLSATFTVNSSTGVATIPSQPIGTAMIVYSEILNSSTTATVPKTIFGLYWTAQGAARINFAAIPSPVTQAALIAYMQGQALIPQNTGNWVSCENVSTLVTQAAPAGVFVFGGLLKVIQSGIFRVDIDLDFSGNTTADTLTVAFVTDTSAAGQLAGTGRTAVGIAGYGVVAGLGGNDLEAITGASGNAITYNGGAFATAPIVQKTVIYPTLTGQISGGIFKFNFHGIVHNAISTTRTPFLAGQTVGFGIKVSATNSVVMPNINCTIQEL